MTAFSARHLLAALGIGALASVTLGAQTPRGEAAALRVTDALGVVRAVAHASLQSGEFGRADVDSVREARLATGTAATTTSGAAGESGVTSVATVFDVNLLDGLITAANVTAIATATAAGYDASGSAFDGMVVNKVPVGPMVAPNTRITLPGVGYVILNEQVTADGALTVNMIRLVVTSGANALRGETIVAQARSAR